MTDANTAPPAAAPLTPPFVALALLLLFFAVLGAGAVATRPDPLAAAETLLAEGYYYAALHRYAAHAAHPQHATDPRVPLRLGMLRAIRGEYAPAEALLWQSLVDDRLPPLEAERARLYLAYVREQRDSDARAVWQRSTACQLPACPLVGIDAVLRAHTLRDRDPAAAAVLLDRALAVSLPADWHAVATLDRALLLAAADPAAARAVLALPPAPTAPARDALLAPLVPGDAATLHRALTVALDTPADERALGLGQVYAAAGMPQAALAQFAMVPDSHPHALNAAARAAAIATRTNNDSRAVLARLARLIDQQRGDQRAPALLLLNQLLQPGQYDATRFAATLADLPRNDAATYLTRAAAAAYDGDYAATMNAYVWALRLANSDQRGPYALLIADFALRTGYGMCDAGTLAAAQATTSLPATAAAWTTHAGIAYQCSDFATAQTAAARALALAPNDPAALFYAGATRAHRGNAAARPWLVAAADAAPASVWRERAELLLDEW